jgi:RNA polymerase sigma factor (sigma-70 family)
MKSRNEQISTLYRDHQMTVQRRVQRHVNAPVATIEDACSWAWTQLITHPAAPLGDEHQALAWLTTVAIRQAWKLARRETRARSFDEFPTTDDGTVLDLLPAPENVEQTVLGRDRLRALKALTDRNLPALTERQRLLLVLQAAGYTYDEIVAITGMTRRTVERQLLRASERANEHDPTRT